jgi:hypothetical protein
MTCIPKNSHGKAGLARSRQLRGNTLRESRPNDETVTENETGGLFTSGQRLSLILRRLWRLRKGVT